MTTVNVNKSETEVADERLSSLSFWRKLFARPELGAIVGAIGIFVFFGLVDSQFWKLATAARYLDFAAPLTIMAVAVALLMIGGEFDLSSGALVGSSSLLTGILATEANLHLLVAMFLSLIFALLIGFTNAQLVLRTKLPSFIITLGTMFILLGANVGLTSAMVGTVRVEGLDEVAGYEPVRWILSKSVGEPPEDFRVIILWALGITAAASWVLLRTRIGNWIFAVGGDSTSARSVGVPVEKTKTGLFMYVSFSAWLIGVTSIVRLTSTQSSLGRGEEFQYIIAAVVGGCLLTGGFGSAAGAAVGALIMAMVFIGIPTIGWEPDWRLSFFGALLLMAVLLNNWVRKKAQETAK